MMNINDLKALNKAGKNLSEQFNRAEPCFKAWLIFFYIGANPKCSTTSLCRALDMKMNTASKCIRMWAKADHLDKPGFNMISRVVESRYVELSLNQSGMALYESLESAA